MCARCLALWGLEFSSPNTLWGFPLADAIKAMIRFQTIFKGKKLGTESTFVCSFKVSWARKTRRLPNAKAKFDDSLLLMNEKERKRWKIKLTYINMYNKRNPFWGSESSFWLAWSIQKGVFVVSLNTVFGSRRLESQIFKSVRYFRLLD